MKPPRFLVFTIDFPILVPRVIGMRHILIQCLLILIFQHSYSKEYACLKGYQNETGKTELKPSDWLKKDRKQNTTVWQQANLYNLTHHLPEEYKTIKQRRDFYEWYMKAIYEKGQAVLWPTMSHFISKKLALTKSFPYSVFIRKEVKDYAYLGSESVFNSSFGYLDALMHQPDALTKEEALKWDKTILHKEQYEWLQSIYDEIDGETLKVIDKMAKGKGFYRLMVSKAIRFEGNISQDEDRYQYALYTLRPYFEK